MNPKQRETSLEKIRNSRSTHVILISFKAGGAGLNLTACNHVILVDLWWNPALEVGIFGLFGPGFSAYRCIGTSIWSCVPLWSGARGNDLQAHN